MGRLFQATRIVCDVDLGRILSWDGIGFHVDLTPFYEVVAGRSERDVDRALLEFYAKAVVGLLTRLNRNYIGKSPSNRKVFTTALRKLHDLIFLAREVDRFEDRARSAESDLGDLLAEVGGRSLAVYIGGAALPDLEIEFASPEFSGEPGSSSGIRTVRTAMRLSHGDGPELRRASLVNARGEDREHPLSSRDLTHVTFLTETGEVVWRRSALPLDHGREVPKSCEAGQ